MKKISELPPRPQWQTYERWPKGKWPRPDTVAERLTNYTVDDNGCWNWGGYVSECGYGRIMVRGTLWYVQRLAYVQHIDVIPDGMKVSTLCDNKLCINPAHLYLRPTRTLTPAQVIEIRQRYVTEWITQQELGEEFGLSAGHISVVLHPQLGLAYSDVPDLNGVTWRP